MKSIVTKYSLLLLFIGLTVLSAKQQNVLIIMVDDLGYADLSCYGSKDMRTPALDKLVSEGMRFNEFYSNSCVCSPTRAALLTGRYPELVGMPGVNRLHNDDSWGFLTKDTIMLPELFQKAGYTTSLIGKWHLGIVEGNRPNQRGFGEFKGFLLGMMDDFWEHSRQGMHQMRRNETPIYPKGHATDLITEWSIEALQRDAASEKPFFQFLAYNAPHFPVQPPIEWLYRVKKREPGIEETRARMVAFVEHLDYGIGQVLDALDDLNLRDETIVVFTSDNGGLLSVGSNNGSLREGKTHVYEGGIKVPTCIRWPGRIKAGQSTEFSALTMDIIPTLAELCDIPVEHEIEGRSFSKLLLTGEQEAFQRPVFHMWLQKYKTKESIRAGDWKLLNDQWHPLGERDGVTYELYNIACDPGEQKNLADSLPERTEEMASSLEAHMQNTQKIEWRRPEE
ncbi:MAG: sulfatase-like hydrolase/transferase [Puniceicoccaceae bacterium]